MSEVNLGGECLCGRGQTIGTCKWTMGRMSFRAFHDGPPNYHLWNVTDWKCVDCIADAALAVATGEVREQMREIGRQRYADAPLPVA